MRLSGTLPSVEPILYRSGHVRARENSGFENAILDGE